MDTHTYYGGAYYIDQRGDWRYVESRTLVPQATRYVADNGEQHCVAPEFVAALMLDTNGVAALLNVDPKSVSRMLSRKEMPDPQVRIGKSPLWTVPVIQQWRKSRPGKGANLRNRGKAA